jgi:hypothetical protein
LLVARDDGDIVMVPGVLTLLGRTTIQRRADTAGWCRRSCRPSAVVELCHAQYCTSKPIEIVLCGSATTNAAPGE